MTAPVLRRQQLVLSRALRLGRPAPAGLLRAAAGGGPARLDVYQQAYQARLLAALRDNFEMLARALGDEAFDALGRAYAAAQPSRRPSIRWFGHRLAEFMDRQAAEAGGLVPHPALADLARMDWALRGAFDAADGSVIGREALAALPAEAWPALRLHLHPSVQRVSLQWAVEPAWRALRASDVGAEPALEAPQAMPHTLLVWRRGLQTQWRSLDEAEAALLAAVARGRTFGRCCEIAAAWPDIAGDAALRVVGGLQQWLDEGLLSRVDPP